MLGVLGYLVSLLHISSTSSATPPATNMQLQRLRSSIDLPDHPSNISHAAINISSTTLYDGRPIECFAQRKRPLSPLRTAIPMDCYATMARALLIGDDVMNRQRWTRDRVPSSWIAGTCLIILDSNDMTIVDDFSKAEIAHLAAAIAYPCVAENPLPLGGRTIIGERGQFTVTVFGRGIL
ncbi:MAG: hypothetical protein L6R40_004560 [Gallowayella cf. fulva]|nr:MAG: hypothetical protein L6R40_004560 [Xanthomendoza cf. fulva]